MNTDRNKDTLAKLYERGFGAGDMQAVDSLVTPDRPFRVDVADVCRFAPDGRIAEHWGFLNIPAILQQLGAPAASPNR